MICMIDNQYNKEKEWNVGDGERIEFISGSGCGAACPYR